MFVGTINIITEQVVFDTKTVTAESKVKHDNNLTENVFILYLYTRKITCLVMTTVSVYLNNEDTQI